MSSYCIKTLLPPSKKKSLSIYSSNHTDSDFHIEGSGIESSGVADNRSKLSLSITVRIELTLVMKIFPSKNASRFLGRHFYYLEM